jgi:hypothetical protein
LVSKTPARVVLLKYFPVDKRYRFGTCPATVVPSTYRLALYAVFLKSFSSDVISVNKQEHAHVRYRILEVMNMKFKVLWDIMPSSFVSMYCINLQGQCCCVCIHGLFNDTRNEKTTQH